MSCPTCGHSIHALGCKVSGDTFFYCPRCGTILPCTGEVVVPALVERCRNFEFLLCAGGFTGKELIADWDHLGIRESINTPDNR